MKLTAQKQFLSRSKFPNFRLWLTIIPFILLLIGFGATFFLMSSNQDLRQQAAGLIAPYSICRVPRARQCSPDGKSIQTCINYKWVDTTCPYGETCQQNSSGRLQCAPFTNCNAIGHSDDIYECKGNKLYGCVYDQNASGVFAKFKFGVVESCTNGNVCSTAAKTCLAPEGCKQGEVKGCKGDKQIGCSQFPYINGRWVEADCDDGKTCQIKNGKPGCY